MAEIDFSRDGHVAHVRLNRPKSLNAITGDMNRSLLQAWTEINADPDIWVALLSAEGEKAFCAGADVSGDEEPTGRIAFGGGLTGVGGPLLTLKKPLVAAVQGYVLGGGFEMVMCADVMVAASNAQFGMPETKAGIMGESGIMHRAIRQLPHRVAMAMILTGERLPAPQALNFGLVNEVVEPVDLMAAAQRWVDKLLAASPLAAQAAKAAVLSRADMPLELALSTRYEPIEAYAFAADRLEGRTAFAEKRKPQWQGR
ncbi:enoyl-CoA hydratase-related protein [Comamonadaceae bacterium G21597-S1]|nr:enoyl-CoA hydratase-related protein [Comamonadaceae bacterium G21597-S1]